MATDFEIREETGAAIEAYRGAARAEPRDPTPLFAAAHLLARAGRLAEADQAITDYCRAAVSVLAEKQHIQSMRAFQHALRRGGEVNGYELLLATREAYAQGFTESLTKLPERIQLEAEPFRSGPDGAPEPVLPNANRPFARVRFDAIEPSTGKSWMLQETPTYGYPAEGPAAVEGCFSVPLLAKVPFPVFLATRTAWDYFFVRIRFAGERMEATVAACEQHFGHWYERGFAGDYRDGGRGYFHFVSEPFLISNDGVRYEFDLGLSGIEALGGLFEALTALHGSAPISLVMLGDGALPPLS